MSCGVGCRFGSDPELLWFWRRPVARSPIRPLAWEPPYTKEATLEKAKRQKKKKKKKNDIMPFAATWMELENLSLSEMSQKDKDTYHMISLITGI